MADGSSHAESDIGYYCYCVVGPDVQLALDGLRPVAGALPPYAITAGELQAVLSLVPMAEYCEERLRANLRRLEWMETAVLTHEHVVEGCLRQTDVVPMKFCTIFRSEWDVVAAIGSRQEELMAKLLYLRGKQEWGIRLVANLELFRRHLLDNDPEVLRLRNGLAARSAGAAYLLKKRMEDQFARFAEQCRADAAKDAYARLASVATRAALLKPLGSAAGEGELVLNAAFLVNAEQLGKLLEEAEQIVSERPWLGWVPSGPWPPYSFV